MAGLSRREFLAATGGLALLWGFPKGQLGNALAAPQRAKDIPTTLLQTIRQRTVGNLSYRTLAPAPGEPYIPRSDLLGRRGDPARTQKRRSIVYLGHMTDIHVMDPQSPARLEPLWAVSNSTFAGTIRPQDALTVHVQAQMVEALTAARYSPLTGAPMAAVFNTGDSADQHSMLELRWYIDTMDGQQVTPNSGKPGEYEGPQVWSEATYAWHPEDPGSDPFGQYGFPRLPGMLTAAVSEPVSSGGLPVPWYAVYGNHDTLYYGAFPIDASLRSLATGDRKPALPEALVGTYFDGMASDPTVLGRLGHTLRTQFGMQSGMRSVTADPNRKLFEQREFVAEHFNTQPLPGPVGHGFTQENLDKGTGYWAVDIGAHLRLFGLDTCNQVMGADGAVPQDQFDWLKAGLAAARDQNKLAIVISHHNSKTLENTAVAAVGPSQRLINTDEFVAMLLEYPNLIAWSNGHTHINTIVAHPRRSPSDSTRAPSDSTRSPSDSTRSPSDSTRAPSDSTRSPSDSTRSPSDSTRSPSGVEGGFWEITTASCIDFPQQQQLLEVVDNRDGTISIFATTVDHLSPAAWRTGDFSQQGLAAMSREVASNDWTANPLMRRGSPLDRNVELLLPAPFDMSVITDRSLESETMARRARLAAVDRQAGV